MTDTGRKVRKRRRRERVFEALDRAVAAIIRVLFW
jgi:hypothetical protein